MGMAGRKDKFRAAEDLVLAKEVYAGEDRVALHGERLVRFERSSAKCNANPSLKLRSVRGKFIRARLKSLISEFATKNNEQDADRNGRRDRRSRSPFVRNERSNQGLRLR